MAFIHPPRAMSSSPRGSALGRPGAPGSIERLRPGRERRQGHEDRLGIAAGHQAEARAAVIEEVELHVAAAPRELMPALRLGPARVHMPPHDGGIGGEKGAADILHKGEATLPVTALQIVEEDAACAARLAPVLDEEILVAPGL